jgi:hypothetical protein
MIMFGIFAFSGCATQSTEQLVNEITLVPDPSMISEVIRNEIISFEKTVDY